jgi:hypothetical protein
MINLPVTIATLLLNRLTLAILVERERERDV